MRIRGNYLLFSLVSLFICLSALFLHEFIFQKTAIKFGSVFFGVSSIIFLTQVSSKKMKLIHKYSWKFLVVLISFVFIHFLLSSIDFYRLFNPPTIFYTIKLHRFLTLSGFFIVHLLFLAVSFVLISSARIKEKIKLSLTIPTLILVYLLAILFYQTESVLADDYTVLAQIILNTDTEFEDRITYRLGGTSYFGWIWPYAQFIKRHTEDNSVIVIPPQEMPWKMEGNTDYFRWFMYPRKLYHLEYLQNNPDLKIDYIVISAGECDTKDCVWPDYLIEKEKIEQIILIDRETQKIEFLDDKNFIPVDFYSKWGLIKLK